jgi:hypothetical protein
MDTVLIFWIGPKVTIDESFTSYTRPDNTHSALNEHNGYPLQKITGEMYLLF